MRRAENKEKRPIYLKRKGDDKLLCSVLLNRLAIFQRKLILKNGGNIKKRVILILAFTLLTLMLLLLTSCSEFNYVKAGEIDETQNTEDTTNDTIVWQPLESGISSNGILSDYKKG